MSGFDDRVDFFDEMREAAWGRAMTAAFIDFIEPHEAWSALDVGCGAGNLAMALAPRVARVSGIDDAERMVERAQAKCRAAQFTTCDFRVGDACRIPFRDGDFDLVTTSAVLYLVGDQEKAAEEISRVSARSGIIAVHEPAPDMTPDTMDAYMARARERGVDIPNGIAGWARAAVSHAPLDEEGLAELFAPHGLGVSRSRRLLDGLAIEAVLARA